MQIEPQTRPLCHQLILKIFSLTRRLEFRLRVRPRHALFRWRRHAIVSIRQAVQFAVLLLACRSHTLCPGIRDGLALGQIFAEVSRSTVTAHAMRFHINAKRVSAPNCEATRYPAWSSGRGRDVTESPTLPPMTVAWPAPTSMIKSE